MGDVVRSSAAVIIIFADLRSAYTNGVAKKGTIQEIVERDIGGMVAMVDAIEAELAEAEKTAAPHSSAVDAANDAADAKLARLYDDVWNDVGRPANDRALSLLFPGGTSYYADGDTAQQPLRMELLAQLFDRGLHPQLSSEQSKKYAQAVREEAAELKTVLDTASVPVARVTFLSRIRTALGRAAQAELSKLKRSLKNAGYSETEIHTVIPDRPPAKKTSAKQPAAKSDESKKENL